MTAFVLPNLDQSTIDELRKRIPDLSEIDLPSLEKVGKDVGKTADQTLDRLLGRNKMSIWPWVAASIGLAAVIGAVGAWFAWMRKPASMDTLVDDEIGSWQAPNNGAGGLGTDLGTPTDLTIDRTTTEAIGTFGERSADEYPTA